MDVIPKGAKVRQIVKPIEGEIESTRFNEGTQSLEYHVMRTGEDGRPHGIWMAADQVEAIDTDDTDDSKEQA